MNWLEELKPGDRVLVRNRCQPHDRIETIKTIGKKLISLEGWEDKTRFRVDGGRSVSGDSYNCSWLHPATEEAIEKIEEQKQKLEAIKKLQEVNFGKLPLEKLKQILKILEG